MTISKIVSFLNTKAFDKREESIVLSLSPILFLLGLRYCGVCLLSIGTKECRFKVKLDLLALQGLGRALETISCSKRWLRSRLSIGERGKLSGGSMGGKRHVRLRDILEQILWANTTSCARGVEFKG